MKENKYIAKLELKVPALCEFERLRANMKKEKICLATGGR